jgi:3-hydroxyisobutyrate dehydrogenase-like beta-hydroxyacid dehydrogenase
MVNNDFKPGFYVEHYIKDMEIALEGEKISNVAILFIK